MKENNFLYCERDMGLKSDNEINYYAGPIKISISGGDQIIELKSKKEGEGLLKECLETAKIAGKLKDNQITLEENENYSTIRIKYNFENLKLYIEHSLVFM